VETKWDDCNVWAQAMLIGYNQIREHEEMEELAAGVGVKL